MCSLPFIEDVCTSIWCPLGCSWAHCQLEAHAQNALILGIMLSCNRATKFWNYRDEDVGGSVARQSKMKGSWKKMSAFCKHGLDMFKMKNKAPRIVDDA